MEQTRIFTIQYAGFIRQCIFKIIHALLLLCLTGSARAQLARLDSVSHTLLLQGIHQVHIEAYDDALATFDTLMMHRPEHPIGYFGASAVYKTIMQNYRVKTYESQLDSLLDLTVAVGEKAVRKNRRDVLAYFYMGGAYGFRGLHKIRKRDWLGAFKDGVKGLNDIQTALDRDPKMYDAYYGLGTFHYWRSAKTKLLGLLPLFRKDKQRGIFEIEVAIEKGTYTPVECQYALVPIYYDSGEYDKALKVNQNLFDQFPANPSCLYMRSRIFEQLANWDEALIAVKGLLAHIEASKYQSIGYHMECHYLMAYYLHQLDRDGMALQHLEKFQTFKEKRDASGELEGPLENIDEIVENARGLHAQIIQTTNGTTLYNPGQ
ncbi:tetratricopeptide repeat protein [bacterium]